jgi:hypothetical protein
MPTAMAVRKAKETMAASTLSLILRVIVASSCRKEPALRHPLMQGRSWGIYFSLCGMPSKIEQN